jgi:hypothetical protein
MCGQGRVVFNNGIQHSSFVCCWEGKIMKDFRKDVIFISITIYHRVGGPNRNSFPHILEEFKIKVSSGLFLLKSVSLSCKQMSSSSVFTAFPLHMSVA